MSSRDRIALLPRRMMMAGALAALALTAGCSVQPLYSNTTTASTGGGTSSVAAELSMVSVKPVETRYAQQVRNHLIFLFGKGQGQPAEPAYTMTLNVTALRESAAEVQVAQDNEPSAGTITLTADYTLTEAATGEEIGKGTRRIASSFDIPRQEFAAVRAQRDAEDRAARELAELLNLSVAQDLTKAR